MERFGLGEEYLDMCEQHPVPMRMVRVRFPATSVISLSKVKDMFLDNLILEYMFLYRKYEQHFRCPNQ